MERMACDFNISIEELMGKRRQKHIVDARCVVASVFSSLGYSQPAIGELLGGRDNTTAGNLLRRAKGRKDLMKIINGYIQIFKV